MLFRQSPGRALCAVVAVCAISYSVETAAEECPSERPPRAHAPAPRAAPNAPTFIHADSARATPDGVTIFRGDVEVKRGSQQLSADELRYDRGSGQTDASGNVTLSDTAGTRYQVPELHLNLETRVGHGDAGTYQLPAGQGRGDMRRTQFEGPDHTRLHEARYTTCPAGRDDWYIKAQEIEIDTAADVGVARHMRLEFLGVPLLYLPYFTFPISDERKSGFLFPELGYDSRLGAVLGTPYYWNIAPNYDATLTPRLLAQRGVQLQNQFRYLGQGFDGRLEVEYLPNDNRSENHHRAATTYVHSHVFNPWWTGSVDLRAVSDKDYLNDFGDHLNVTAQTHLPQNAEINFRGPVWNFTARAADYQTVDQTIAPADRPYARLPQLLFGARPPAEGNGPQYRFDGELVNFERRASTTGQRVHVNPAIALPWVRPYGFLTPELGARHIEYNLRDAPEENPAVSAPYLSLDSGLVFERPFQFGTREYMQTLEPRVYYLYVPFRPQDDLPNFDTTLPDFTFANLFRNNRFIGGDRIGDANQATFAVTSRFLDEADGTERLRASIGQIRYFADRRVNVPATAAVTNRSDLAAEAAAWLVGNWYLNAAIQWNPERDETQRSSYYLQYQPAPDRIVNIGHRMLRSDSNNFEQLDVSSEWPVSRRWTVRARTLYSQRDNENVESYLGLQYNACCWVARLHVARRLIQTGTDATTSITEQSREFMLQLELSGLGKLGTAPDSPLKQSLFGFAPGAAGIAPR